MPSLGESIVAACLEMGFALAGIAPARASNRAEELRAWLAAGRHGEMTYLEDDLSIRCDPRRLLRGTRAFVMVADQYATRAPDPDPAPDAGRIARYARGRDYHRAIKKRLHSLSDRLRDEHPGARFRSFVDTAPVMERELALDAGLGWIGKHTLVIHPRAGSYLLLGGIATTLELEASPGTIEDACGTCTRCIQACPTGAITPYSVDATRCISYLTIEHRGEIDPAMHAAIGDRLFGCDICQEVCPHNSPRQGVPAASIHPAYTPTNSSLPLLEVLGWDESGRRSAFASSAMKRATLAMMKRNAVILAGNALARRPDPALEARVRAIAIDQAEPAIVRSAASAVLEGLSRRR